MNLQQGITVEYYTVTDDVKRLQLGLQSRLSMTCIAKCLSSMAMPYVITVAKQLYNQRARVHKFDGVDSRPC